MVKDMKINALPVKTWHFLKVNEALLPWDEDNETLLNKEIVSFENDQYRYSIADEINNSSYAKKEIDIAVNEGESRLIYLSSDTLANTMLNVNALVKGGALLKIVELMLPGEESFAYSKISGKCESNGRIEIVRVCLGEGNVYGDIQVDLLGDKSSLKIDIGYIGQKKQNIDLNIVANHFGKKTECEINVNGTLKDEAKKNFKGTIDFKNGCSGSVGNEIENVLLLGDDIVNKTVPVILCAEEDVVGNHGATIGDLDEDTMFYFESRGINPELAKNIMARASIERMFKLIDDEEINDVITKRLEKVLA